MDDFTVYDAYDPDHLAWLRPRRMSGRDVVAADLARLIRANPDVISDPLLSEYLLKALDKKLKKKPGRPKLGVSHEFRIWAAGERVTALAARIKAMRQRRPVQRFKSSVHLSPMELAAEHVARRMKLGAGTTLLKDISRQKSCGLFGR